MKTHSILLAFLCVFSPAFAQINVQFNGINEYSFNAKEALNLTVINSGTKSFEIEFKGRINSEDGQLVVEFTSNPALLNMGANVFNQMNTGISRQIYYNQDIAEIESKTGTYPSGNYTICIWTACVQADCNGAGEYAGSLENPICTQIHIENPTPLLLALPENEAEIEETRPLYSWIPPAPIAGSASLTYTMILVEIMEGQNKADALLLNRPFIHQESIGNPMLMHPSDIPELEVGKTYAWQVEAYVGRTSVGKSEQWKFKIKEKEEEKKPSNRMYVLLKTDDKDIHHVSDTLKVLYKESKKSDKLNIVIKNDKGEIVHSDTTQTSKYGENSYKFNLEGIEYLYNKQYLLTLTNSSGSRYDLKFIVIKS